VRLADGQHHGLPLCSSKGHLEYSNIGYWIFISFIIFITRLFLWAMLCTCHGRPGRALIPRGRHSTATRKPYSVGPGTVPSCNSNSLGEGDVWLLHGHEPCGHGKDDTCTSNPVDVRCRRRVRLRLPLFPTGPTPQCTVMYEALRCGVRYRIAGGIAVLHSRVSKPETCASWLDSWSLRPESVLQSSIEVRVCVP
jgi:hypothetical protein